MPPNDFTQTLKLQADIVRIVGEYVQLKKSGAQNYSGLCPFHKEKTGSFSVHATKQFYHCFGCGVSGDVFSFVQKIENVTFPEAVKIVAQKLGVPLPKQEFSSPAEAREAGQRGALLDLQERACAFFQEQLKRPEGANAREYLAGRGLDAAMIEKFRIGFAPDSGFVLRDALRGKFDEELFRASGLFSWKQEDKSAALYSKFRNRVMFPICNESGRVIAFTGRTLATDEKAGPKYLNSPETAIYSKSRVLFNLDKAKDAVRKLEYSILVEGQMDCISVFAAGFHNVIASSGTAFTEAQARLLARFSRNIVINFDPDTAGAAAAERSLSLLVEEDFNIKVLRLEQGLDPDLFIRKRGAREYADALRQAPKYFDFLIERARASANVKTAEGKVKAVNFLLPHIQRVPSRIVRDQLSADIAQKLGIDSSVLRQELKHAAVARSGSVKSPETPLLGDAERVLLLALVHDLHAEAAEVLLQERLHEGLACEAIVDALLQAPAGADVTELVLSEVDRRLLNALLLHDHEEVTPELLHESFDALRRRGLEHRQRELRAAIADAERRQDHSTMAVLLEQKVQVDKALSGQ